MKRTITFAFVILLATLTACGSETAITRNDDWTLEVREFEGVEMVLVPAGCFMMGSEDGEDNEAPVHEQCVDEPFWIDRYEVTNEQYGSSGEWSGDNLPRDSVSWFDATAHCESRGARLPTESEWEYAARGPDSLIYPWGNGFVEDNVVYRSNSGNKTIEVGNRPGGVSWVGAYDMSGNVWEWISSLDEDYPYNASDGRERDTEDNTDVRRVFRGGSWADFSPAGLRAAYRGMHSPGGSSSYGGFRCARSDSSNS